MMIIPAAERCGKPAGFSKGLWESHQRFPWSRRLSAAGGSAPEIRPSFVSKSLTRSEALGNGRRIAPPHHEAGDQGQETCLKLGPSLEAMGLPGGGGHGLQKPVYERSKPRRAPDIPGHRHKPAVLGTDKR